ncbi:MAG: FAD binding domain-containing protein [Burkholderiales bacterium]|nr:FAD binding domain-containing protein [Burkholderiales bacterium]
MRKAIIVGGSLGGLLVANLLHRQGWDVNVYERVAEELEGRGAGIVTHAELLEVLEACEVSTDASIGVSVQERVTLARDGSVAGRLALPQVLTAWSRLFHDLKQAFPAERYHNGMKLSSLSQDNDSVTAVFENGTSVHADLLVGADGIRSTVRHMLLPEATPQYAGYIGWRGLVDESALSDRARAEAFPYFAFGLPPREQFIAYPVAGSSNSTAVGKRRFNFVWYRPADEATTLRDLLTDASGKVWSDGIPPPLIRAEVLNQARQAAREVLAPQFAEVVEKTENLFFQPIFDLESPQLAFGRVALLGDAAFVARPHCGMGVTKAGADARDLVRHLNAHESIQAALQGYQGERSEFGRFIVGHARALGAYMQAQLRTEEERAMAEKYRTVDAVMRETAVAPAAH